MQAAAKAFSFRTRPVHHRKNNSDASGHEQKLNLSKLLSKMSLRCWAKCKRPTISKSFGSSSTRRNLRSKQRGPQRITERERKFSPALRIIYL
jgi:hypothetical protein